MTAPISYMIAVRRSIGYFELRIWVKWKEKRSKCYPRSAQRTIFDILGGVPCIKIAMRNILPPAQTNNNVNNITPIRPTYGCQAGILSGVAILKIISRGVRGGISDIQVEKLLNGSLAIGKYMNMGIRAGKITGKVRD